jgi:MFS family permease
VVAFIRSERRISTLVALTGLLSIFGYPFLTMMPVFARDVLHAGARGYGALMAAVGIGAMLGALALAAQPRRIPKGPSLVVGGAAFSVLLAAFALSRTFLLSVVLLALTGAAMIVTTALTNTILQTAVPDHLRGRVMGFYSFVFVGMAPLGAFEAGALAEHVGAPRAVAAGALVCLFAVATAAWRTPELRKA